MRRGLVGGALLLLAGLGLPRAWPLLLALPIHFHALLSLPFGLLCWAVNVHVLGLAGIDVPLLGFPPTPPATLYLVVLAVSSVVALGVAWYGLTHWEFVPTVAYAVLIGGLLWPGTLWKDERSRFIGSVH